MNIAINKDNLISLLPQFEGDIPYQTAMVTKLIEQMPTAYVDMIITKLYFQRCCYREYFILHHKTGYDIYLLDEKDIRKYFVIHYPASTAFAVAQLVNGTRSEYMGYTLARKARANVL